MNQSIDHELLTKLKGCVYGDYNAAIKSLEMVFKQRSVLATAAYSTGDKDALDGVAYLNDIIKKALYL